MVIRTLLLLILKVLLFEVQEFGLYSIWKKLVWTSAFILHHFHCAALVCRSLLTPLLHCHCSVIAACYWSI